MTATDVTTKTPRTDAEVLHHCRIGGRVVTSDTGSVHADFARELERELATLTQRLAGVTAERDEARESAEDEAHVRELLARRLAEVCLALKGPDEPLTRHDWSDLGALAARTKLACDFAEVLLDEERALVTSLSAALRELLPIVAMVVDDQELLNHEDQQCDDLCGSVVCHNYGCIPQKLRAGRDALCALPEDGKETKDE